MEKISIKIILTLVTTWAALGVKGQTFTGVDDLGRILPQFSEVGPQKKDKQIGLFYFLWQGDDGSPTSAHQWDLDKLYQYSPEVFQDFYHPGWGGGASGAGKYYFWGEPIYGYYRGDDYWVHLKNIQLLTDAEVDFLVIDATNRLTYFKQCDALMKAMDAVRKQGKTPPKIVFYTNTASGEAMQEIYKNFYGPQAISNYPDNWYYLEGKPLIIGLSKEAAGRDYESFFTIRESQWPNEAEKVNGWPWIEFQRPQRVYKNKSGQKEIINVSAAQHPNLDASMGGSAFYGKSGNWGRSFHKGSPGNPSKDIYYGYNIQEQWDFALSQDVPFIFITGWNEWIAGKWSRADENKHHAHFVDQANPEYSRDIEPSWTAGLKDTYYLQMIANIRRYKGTNPPLYVNKDGSPQKSINWKDITPLYTDFTGDVLHRSHPGAQSEPKIIYENKTGRNDFKVLKLAASSKDLSFYVQTVDKISTKAGRDWMTLWLNIDESYLSGWNGYDFRVVNGDQLQRYINGSWKDVATVPCEILDNEMIVNISYEKLGLSVEGASIEFKWSDNMQKDDPLDWYLNGDTAPGGRLNLTVKIK